MQPTVKKQFMRRFFLERVEDATGTSGAGIVAEGCEMSNGRVALTWYSHYGTVATYDNIKTINVLHGHEGRTKVQWIDPEVF